MGLQHNNPTCGLWKQESVIISTATLNQTKQKKVPPKKRYPQSKLGYLISTLSQGRTQEKSSRYHKSSLVFADGHLKIHFSFTRDSYKGFLLRHGSFSYV